MENQDLLNPDNEYHVWCLHYVFLPIVNRHIKNWKDAWVNHPIRTERNKTPIQLSVTGLQLAGNFQEVSSDILQVPMLNPLYVYTILFEHILTVSAQFYFVH